MTKRRPGIWPPNGGPVPIGPRFSRLPKTAGGSAVQLDDTTETGIPDPTLAKAAFAAQPDSVSDPVKTALGWDVLKVIKAIPGSEKTFEQAKPEVRDRVLADKAAGQIYEAASKIDDILGTGVGLDKVPSDLGAVGVEGTLDANGDTADGKPAPIPGPAGPQSAGGNSLQDIGGPAAGAVDKSTCGARCPCLFRADGRKYLAAVQKAF